MASGTEAARLWDMAQLGTPLALRVAATLRIADQLTERPMSAVELAHTVSASADALDRVLRHLAGKGVLRHDGSGRYTLTELGAALRTGHPGGVQALLDAGSAIGRGDLAFVQLLHSVRTGLPGYRVHYGNCFWDDLDADPALAASFYDQMNAHVAAVGAAIVAGYDWEKLTHLVDVGGGDGALLAAILQAYQDLPGTLVDLPATAAMARENLAARGLTERADVVAGSFFDPLPRPDGASYLLCQVIHDWGDEKARAILARCVEAAGPGGRVFVVERAGACGENLHAAMDLRMLVYYGGKERSAAELVDLAGSAGLHLAAVHTEEPVSITEFVVD